MNDQQTNEEIRNKMLKFLESGAGEIDQQS